LRYRPKTELVLKNLSFTIEKGLKIGIVGRTGAGKSTISVALTRIVELESGSIEIDGVNIGNMDIIQLRERITIIPQDPTLFTGSLRFNVDPSRKYTDAQIIELLKKAGLSDVLQRAKTSKSEAADSAQSSKETAGNEDQENENGLDFEIAENGGNLSTGEK